ncbi:MAG: hypothetical protein R6W82_10840 [bacterium]
MESIEESMKMIKKPMTAAAAFLLLLALGACGEPPPEELLEKSRKVPELYEFGSLYVPLYQEAMEDSNWTPIRENIREINRLKQQVARVGAPKHLTLQKQKWESNQRLFSRAVDNLSVVIQWRGEEAARRQEEIAEGVQRVYDWWYMLVDML